MKWDFHFKVIMMFILFILGSIFDTQDIVQSMFLIFILIEILSYKEIIEKKGSETHK